MALNNKNPSNLELLKFIKNDMRIRKAGGVPSYIPPLDATREEKFIDFFRMARKRFPRQPCPMPYVCWVIDGGAKRLPPTSNAVESLKGLLANRRVVANLAKKNQRIFYTHGVGDDGGYRMNVDDDDLAETVLGTDKRRVQSVMTRAAETHGMIDESKLTTDGARENYGDIGSIVGLLTRAGHLTLPEMSTDAVKRLQSGINKRKKRANGGG